MLVVSDRLLLHLRGKADQGVRRRFDHYHWRYSVLESDQFRELGPGLYHLSRCRGRSQFRFHAHQWFQSFCVCVVSFGSYGSAVTAYLSMGGTNFIVLNETDEASGGWATLGKSVGNATIVTFPGCIITFREQNVVVQMQFTLGTPGSGLDRMAPDPWMMDIAQQQSAEIHHQVDKLS